MNKQLRKGVIAISRRRISCIRIWVVYLWAKIEGPFLSVKMRLQVPSLIAKPCLSRPSKSNAPVYHIHGRLIKQNPACPPHVRSDPLCYLQWGASMIPPAPLPPSDPSTTFPNLPVQLPTALLDILGYCSNAAFTVLLFRSSSHRYLPSPPPPWELSYLLGYI